MNESDGFLVGNRLLTETAPSTASMLEAGRSPLSSFSKTSTWKEVLTTNRWVFTVGTLPDGIFGKDRDFGSVLNSFLGIPKPR
jgi:hypothetical protein